MNKYQWPASKLTEDEMELLFKVRQATSKSICDLLREAVHIAYGEVRDGTIARGISQNSS
ncbi:MAG: hypothetical protein AB1629_00805 [Candidatus Omnitrophota bacterium]